MLIGVGRGLGFLCLLGFFCWVYGRMAGLGGTVSGTGETCFVYRYS